MIKFRYKSLYIFSNLQYCGNLEEYFSKHTEKLVAHIVLPRLRNSYNIVRLYKKGKLVEEKKLWCNENIFLYFSAWFFQHIYIISRYFSPGEKFFTITFMPLIFFGATIQKLFRNIYFVFFIGDYCPAPNFSIRLYEWIKKYYHDRIPYICYLSDTLNKRMNNDKIIRNKNRRTVMWGVKPRHIQRSFPKETFSMLFVGLIKPSQGLEFFYRFLQKNKNCSIKILGVCDEKLYKTHQNLFKKYTIAQQVYFPNKFFLDEEVTEISRECHVGVALYDTGKEHMIYYTEPGKVKLYTELGLPVIMSNVSSIVPYIKKFKAGEIVERNEESVLKAITKIKTQYKEYVLGVKRFNEHFFYETYYKSAFRFLEEKG